jgi:hypothetical protein
MAASDFRVPLDPIFEAFGVPATVTRPAPDEIPILTTGVWVSPLTLDMPPAMEFQRKESQRVMALTRTEVPTVPRGTIIEAPEMLGGTVQRWRIDGIEQTDSDHHRVFLLPDPELGS